MRWAELIAVVFLVSTANPAGAAGRDPLALVEARCQNCHGMTGQSSSPNYPKLASQNAQYLQRQLFNFKSGKRQNTEMQAQVADLTGAEMEALAVYFSTKDIIADVAFDPALAEIGKLLYENGNAANGVTACSACHGPHAHGALFLPRLAGQHASYIERQVKAFIDHTREAPDIVMHTVVAGLTEAEIIAVAQYLSGLD